MALTNEQLAEIRKRAEAATAGPWKVDEAGYVGQSGWISDIIIEAEKGIIAREIFEEADAEFIAHAREDVPELLAEIERLRRELSFIAHVDLVTNAYDKEHIAVSVKSWALNVLEGVNHDGSDI